jgi:large subunit ribosomal protein L9
MKVILLERVGKSGHIGDEVVVKDGYARNYLLPQHKALRATEANRKKFAVERVSIEKRNAERRDAAAGIAAGLNGRTVVIIRQAGETGQLYGSVSSRDVADALTAAVRREDRS